MSGGQSARAVRDGAICLFRVRERTRYAVCFSIRLTEDKNAKDIPLVPGNAGTQVPSDSYYP